MSIRTPSVFCGLRAAILTLSILAFASLAPLLAQEAGDEAVFAVPTLNEGLGPVPEDIDRSSPRQTIASLLRAADTDDWDAAAHLMDLGALEPEEQASLGPDYARMLLLVMERRTVLDWSLLRDRPDALDPNAPEQDPLAGQSRRSLLLAELALEPVPATINLDRLRPGPEGSDPVWVFPQRTVADIPRLYERYGPSDFEQALPAALRETGFWGLMWWELIGLPVLLLLTALAGVMTSRAIDALRQRQLYVLRPVVEAARNPAIIAAVTAVLAIGATEIFVFSSMLSAAIVPLIAIGYTTAVLMLVMNGLAAILHVVVGPDDTDLTARELVEQRRAATRLAALRHGLTVVVFLVGAGVILSSADLFGNLGLSLLASAGAVTLVIGIAAREVLGNILASLQIALNQSARVGDRIMWKDMLCYVEAIHFTYVLLRNWDTTRVIVPVSEFISETFSNWTLEDPSMLAILKMKFAPRADVAALRTAFEGILEDMVADGWEEEIDALDQAKVSVAGQDALGVDVWFAIPCLDPSTQWDVACTVRERLIAAANEIAEREDVVMFPDSAAMEAAA